MELMAVKNFKVNVFAKDSEIATNLDLMLAQLYEDIDEARESDIFDGVTLDKLVYIIKVGNYGEL